MLRTLPLKPQSLQAGPTCRSRKTLPATAVSFRGGHDAREPSHRSQQLPYSQQTTPSVPRALARWANGGAQPMRGLGQWEGSADDRARPMGGHGGRWAGLAAPRGGAGQRGAAGSGGGGNGRSRAVPGLGGGHDAGPLPGEEGEQPRWDGGGLRGERGEHLGGGGDRELVCVRGGGQLRYRGHRLRRSLCPSRGEPASSSGRDTAGTRPRRDPAPRPSRCCGPAGGGDVAGARRHQLGPAAGPGAERAGPRGAAVSVRGHAGASVRRRSQCPPVSSQAKLSVSVGCFGACLGGRGPVSAIGLFCAALNPALLKAPSFCA